MDFELDDDQQAIMEAVGSLLAQRAGAARAVGKVLPKLAGLLDGMAMRVPVPDGSVTDLVATLKRKVTVEEVNAAFKKAAASKDMKGILVYSEDPLVSSDIVGHPASSIFDSGATMVMRGTTVKIVSWYDNEWGYSSRVVDLVAYADKEKRPARRKRR